MLPPPIYLMPSPAKKLVKPILLVIPSITSISKKKKRVNSTNVFVPSIKDIA